MELIDLEKQYQYREENMKILNQMRMGEILKYFFYLCRSNQINFLNDEDLWDVFITNYKSLVDKGFANDIYLYLKANDFNEDAFIYELLHDRKNNRNIQNLIEKRENCNSITLYNREIQFMDANQYFQNTALEEFFQTKKLEDEFFDRSLELLSYLPNSKAIVSYLPNVFAGGYYHAYISLGNDILVDPTNNLVLFNQEAQNLLKGQVIFELTKEKVEKQLELMNKIKGMSEYDRPLLLKLALFYECNSIDEEELENRRKKYL